MANAVTSYGTDACPPQGTERVNGEQPIPKKTVGAGSVVGDLVKGAVAGLVATKLMGWVTNFIWEHEPLAARQQYERVTGGKYPPDRAAESIERTLHLQVNEKQHGALAQAMHMGLGIGAGMVYALMRRRVRGADRGQGLLFGLLFAAIVDEGLTPLLGLAAVYRFCSSPGCRWHSSPRTGLQSE